MKKRAIVTLVEKNFYFKIETKCPRCGEEVVDNIKKETEYLREQIELVCPECGLVLKEHISFY